MVAHASESPPMSFATVSRALSRRSPVRLRRVLLLGPMIFGMAACGGGNEGVLVSTMSASSAAFSKTMTVTVLGSGLDRGLQVRVDSGCVDVVELEGGDSLTRRFTCKVVDVGPMTIRAQNASSLDVARLQVNVPEPEVVMVIQGVDATAVPITLRLDPKRMPKTAINFLEYVNAGFYRSTLFHRVIESFVVQGGGYTSGPRVKAPTQAPIALEVNTQLSNLRGTIAMARTGDPNSATSQFFINVNDNPSLDYQGPDQPGYAVFGVVVEGMDLIDRLSRVPVRVDLATGLTHLPRTNVTVVNAIQAK